jgi:hypothetical protein
MQAVNNKDELDDFSERLLKGLRKSNYKLIIETAAQNGSLVIGDSKGKWWHEPANAMLDELIAEDSEEFRQIFKEYFKPNFYNPLAYQYLSCLNQTE